MSLINCPNCGKRISDKANICPKCGSIIKKKIIKKKHIKAIKKMIIILTIIGIILVLSVLGILKINRNNIFEKYTLYIGKSYETLPDKYEYLDVIDGFYLAECILMADEVEFSPVDGTMRYFFCEDGFESYDAEPNEIYCMSWYPEYDNISESDIENIRNLLVNSYGQYEWKKEFNNTTELYRYEDENFLCERYFWENKKGIDIIFDVKSESGEYSEINIDWRKSTKE